MKNWEKLCLKPDKEIKQLWNMLNRIWDEEEFIVKYRSDEYFAEMVYSQMRKRNLKIQEIGRNNMLNSIINFLNWTLIYIDNVMHLRMFHAIILIVCTYCIYDECRK